jgi:cation diffusion facilitator family transporter
MEGARVTEQAASQIPDVAASRDPFGQDGGAERDRQVRRVLVIEGAANAALLVAKLVVGFSTGSLAVLGDALHSLTDLANNAVAWIVMRLSAAPPDRDHPYGHRKFETLGVFGLASLMTVLGIELGLSAIRREAAPLARGGWALATMLSVLAINVALSAWEGAWARKLRSDLLLADARHTFSDVLTTIAVIVGWQVAARGYPWLDSAFALGVAALVLYLAYGLFARAVPVLVDQAAIEPERVARIVCAIPGVRGVEGIRSRRTGSAVAVDMVIRVRAHLPTRDAHEIADRVEIAVREQLQAHDVTVHIEPEEAPARPSG